MDDPGSFELVKSKWEIDLKKNKKNRHTFVLLGLKSDTVAFMKKSSSKKSPGEPSEDQNTSAAENLKLKFKKRSVSINSNSSTSKLDFQKSSIADHFDTDEDYSTLKSISCYKKFAKAIGAHSFVSASNNFDEKSFEKIIAYDRFIRNICKISKKATSSSLEAKNEMSSSSSQLG